MRRTRQILQLHFGAQARARAIAGELGVARSTVQGYLARASSAELNWPLPADLTDAMLEERLFSPAKLKPGVRRYVEPDRASLAREMKRPGVDLMILWEEYQQVRPEGCG
jgi:transposase